jgi:acyl carrier protein
MDRLPRIGSKLCRVGLSDQLGLEALKDGTMAAQCHYEGQIPISSTPSERCEIAPDLAQSQIMQVCGVSDVLVRLNSLDGFLDAIIFDSSLRSTPLHDIFTSLRARLEGYLVPNSIKVLSGSIPINADGSVDDAAVEAAVQATNDAALSPTERGVCDLFSEVLQCPSGNLVSSSDFFTSGGNSMGAGRLISRLRQEFRVHLPAEMVFRHSTVGEISHLIEKAVAETKAKEAESGQYPGCRKMYSSTNPIVLILNLLPLGIFYPMLQSLHWTLFIYLMSETSTHWPLRGSLMGRLLHIVLIRLAIRLFMDILCPLLGVAFKWMVIGRYRAGMYPMWGPYHMRWWLTHKVLQLCGKVCLHSLLPASSTRGNTNNM